MHWPHGRCIPQLSCAFLQELQADSTLALVRLPGFKASDGVAVEIVVCTLAWVGELFPVSVRVLSSLRAA